MRADIVNHLLLFGRQGTVQGEGGRAQGEGGGKAKQQGIAANHETGPKAG